MAGDESSWKSELKTEKNELRRDRGDKRLWKGRAAISLFVLWSALHVRSSLQSYRSFQNKFRLPVKTA